MKSAAVWSGGSPPRSGMYPTRSRMAIVSSVTDRPSTRAVPAVGFRMPRSTFMSVLFPAPFAPTSPTLARGMVPVRPLSATSLPYAWVRPSSCMRGVAMYRTEGLRSSPDAKRPTIVSRTRPRDTRRRAIVVPPVLPRQPEDDVVHPELVRLVREIHGELSRRRPLPVFGEVAVEVDHRQHALLRIVVLEVAVELRRHAHQRMGDRSEERRVGKE